jgi:probable HAF family extracellular repeat protein
VGKHTPTHCINRPDQFKEHTFMKVQWFTRVLLVSIMALFTLVSYAPVAAHYGTQYPYTFYAVGTLGGPQSYQEFPGTVLNHRGMVALFGSDIPALDPHAPSACFNADCHISHAAVWQDGRMIDLGAFTGANNSGMGGMSPNGRYVAGLSTDGTLDAAGDTQTVRAALFAHGQVTDLGTLGGSFSGAYDANNHGQVVGVAENAIADPFHGDQGIFNSLPGTNQDRAFLWQHGVMRDLGTLGGDDAAAVYINARGQVAGASFTTTVANPTTGKPTQHPFLWNDGHLIDLGSLGGTSGYSAALNNQGQVVGGMNLAGDQTQHAFLWKDGQLIDLGTLGGVSSHANWENAAGDVVGNADLPTAATHGAFLWKNGTLRDLGRLPGDVCSTATGINTHDQVVGGSQSTCGDGGHGFLWDNGWLVNLNNLVAPVAGWRTQVQFAFSINDQGVIYGVGVLANGDERPIVLVPTHDPKVSSP